MVGYPKAKNELKPRILIERIYHTDSYNKDTKEVMDSYQEITRKYYAQHSGNKNKGSWGESVLKNLHSRPRSGMKEFINQRGWAKY